MAQSLMWNLPGPYSYRRIFRRIFSVHSGMGARERHDMSKEYCVREIPQRKHRTPRELVMGREIERELPLA